MRRSGHRAAWGVYALCASACTNAYVFASDETGGTADPSTGPVSTAASSVGEDADTGAPVTCDRPTGHLVCDDRDELAHPLQTLGLGCDGTPDDSTPIDALNFFSPDFDAHRTPREYGNPVFGPTEGGRLLVLSTGQLPQLDDAGRLVVGVGVTDRPDGDGANPDWQDLPPPFVIASGAVGTPYLDCDGVGDCSETLSAAVDPGGANDLLYFVFEVDVPGRTSGYEVDVAIFSAEYPERVGSEPSDLFAWWQTSDAYTGNVATFGGQAASIDALAPHILSSGPGAATGNDPSLLDTGFYGVESQPCELGGTRYDDCPTGATTGWMTLSGAVRPGERMTIAAALFDQGDRGIDTVVALDNFRWRCDGCTPGSTCGLAPRP